MGAPPASRRSGYPLHHPLQAKARSGWFRFYPSRCRFCLRYSLSKILFFVAFLHSPKKRPKFASHKNKTNE